jgi:hypothetical protein
MKTMMEVNRKRTYGSLSKKLFIILFSLGFAFGVSAQRGGHAVGGGFHGGYVGGYYPRAYVGVGVGYGWGLGWGLGWGYPGLYGPWGYPYPPYYYGYGAMPPQLSDQINGIKGDYKAQIKDVKHDKTLPRDERNQRINQLEKQRDAAITQARHDFYNRSNRNGQPPRYNGNDQQQNNQQPNNQPPNKAQPGPGNGNSSSGDVGPEYSDKNTTKGSQ